MAQLMNAPYSQFFNPVDNTPLSGGKVWTYAPGTTTPKASYTNAAGTIPATNPIILDSFGRAQVWLQGLYQVYLTDASNVPVGPNGGYTDNVTSNTSTGDMAASVYDPANIQQQVVGTTASQVVSNKSFNDDSTYIIDNTDPTKRIRFEISGNTTNTTRILTLPNYDTTLGEATGTWTPVLTYTTPGTLAITYSVQTGIYSKNGKKVTAYFDIATSTYSLGTASGVLRIGGLPFASGGLITTYSPLLAFNGVTKASYTSFSLRLQGTDQFVEGVASGSGIGISTMSTADIVPSSGVVLLRGTIVYEAAT